MVSLPLFAVLTDTRAFDPAAAYAHAQRTFVQGYLEASQREAERGYQRSLLSDPHWARRFQLLEATAMAWRGSNDDLLRLLASDPARKHSTNRDASTPLDSDDRIQEDALEAPALTHLHRFSDAAQKLADADRLCAAKPSPECGAILRAHGQLSLERGQLKDARASFEQSLAFARVHNDPMLAGTALLDLAHTATQQEHHDEALNLWESTYRAAMEIGAEDLAQSALSGEAWEYFSLGNSEKALELYTAAQARAASLGDTEGEIDSLTAAADVYAALGQLASAESSELEAIRLARTINQQGEISDAAMDLAQVYLREGKPDEADRYAGQALTIAEGSGSQIDILNCHLLAGEAAVLRHDWPRADTLLHEVSNSPDSQASMKRDAEHALGNFYEAQGQVAAAEQAYQAAIALVEAARAALEQEASQLPFLSNAARIYDDYIHFLVTQGRANEALEAADWSRARTLQQGLGLISASAATRPPPFRAAEIARRANATLLFYWMGERQSYLWAISAERTMLIPLPPRGEIHGMLERYRRSVLSLKDPLRDGDKDGRALYEMLIAPASAVLAQDRPVVLFVDGEMSQLSFETLVVSSPAPHYWIDDAIVSSAPSIRLFAAKGAAEKAQGKLLLFGNSVSPDPGFPDLPMAALELEKVRKNFPSTEEAVFAGPKATPRAYLESKPELYSYIHFVSHGVSSRTDPLESAVILSRENGGEDSYKLYARDILRHPIAARLVTISACNSSGTQFYAGEGLVGLSWAFLRAGAHNTIGALWEVSDASTPQLMDRLYIELEQGTPPARALRDAKLSLLHSGSYFSRPFYWAPFQLYSGR